MKNTLLWTVLSISVIFAITLGIALYAVLTRPKGEAQAVVPQSSVPIQQQEEPDYQYILKEYNGRLGVFLKGQQQPEKLYDVLIRTLPLQDQQELAEGVKVRDYAQLVSLIEDYSS